MSRILADVVAYGKQYTRSGTAMFFAFAFPILLILIFGAVFSGTGSMGVSVPVQNLDEGQYSEMYLNILRNISVVDIEVIPAGEDFSAYFEDNDLTVAVLIPDDFSEQIELALDNSSQPPAMVTVYGDPSASTFGTVFDLVDYSLANLSSILTQSAPVAIPRYEIPENLGGLTFMDFFLPGVVGLVVMTNTLYIITSACAEYKTRGYFRLLATTSLRKPEWLISKFIFYTSFLIISLLVTFAVGQALFDMTASLTPVAFAFIAAGAFLFLSMGMLLGSIVKDPESASAVANAIGFPMMFLSGIFFQLETMPEYIQAISKVFPLTYFNEGLRATMLEGDTSVALLNLAIVLVMGVVFFILGSRIMSWKER